MSARASRAPDYAGALEYAFARLRAELPSHLHYHGPAHTIDDVVPAVIRLARRAGLPRSQVSLLTVAAAFHDLGHVRCYEGHEDQSIAILVEILPGLGFDAPTIERLIALIDATRLPQTPLNLEQELLADADLDSLGRADFLATSQALLREFEARGQVIGWAEWLQSQIQFVGSHRYFTVYARDLRDEGKRDNLRMLRRLLAQARR